VNPKRIVILGGAARFFAAIMDFEEEMVSARN